jgi:hypothetical protein
MCPGYRHDSIIPRSTSVPRFEPVCLDGPAQSWNGLNGNYASGSVSTRPGPGHASPLSLSVPLRWGIFLRPAGTGLQRGA